MVVVLALWNSISLSFMGAFTPEVLNSYAVELPNDMIFLTDIFLNFFTSYIDEKTGKEITINKKVALNYLKSENFCIDLISVFQFEVLLSVFQLDAYGYVQSNC